MAWHLIEGSDRNGRIYRVGAGEAELDGRRHYAGGYCTYPLRAGERVVSEHATQDEARAACLAAREAAGPQRQQRRAARSRWERDNGLSRRLD